MPHRNTRNTTLPFVVEASLSLRGVEAEIRFYREPEPLEAVLDVPQHTLSMSLTPQVRYSRACYVDSSGRPGPWADVGDISFSPRGARLMVVAPGGADSYRGIYLTYSKPLFERTTGLREVFPASQLPATLDVKSLAMRRDLYRIVKEVSEEGRGRTAITEAMARVVLVELTRCLRTAAEPQPPTRAALASWQLRRITNYVEGMVDHCPGVDELSRLCEMSPRHLSRAFKATTGQTVADYVTGVRMLKARSFLAHTNLPQKEIAHRLGFSSPSSFCTAFGMAVGMTPRQYRQLQGHKEP